jgi:serine/threonine protein kinase
MSSRNPQANTLFLRALELGSGSERSTFLKESCGQDHELREQVEALLRAYESAERSIDTQITRDETVNALAPTEAGPDRGDGDHSGGEDVSDGADDRGAGRGGGTVPDPLLREIGPYKLLQPIGEGGMGKVYMAEQLRPVRRLVALKLIKPGMDSREVLARFSAERQALALMDHPNIAKVLDAGSTEWGSPYFVMELVKGKPITAYCDDEQLTIRQRLELFLPVCQAVQHAHQKGVIHRDLKPSNVMIASYDGRAVPKVIDFGVAKATDSRLTDETLFTGFGAIIGTLEYMSPEQAHLNQIDIDTRSDIYALGVLLYAVLTGSTPLDRKRVKDTPLEEVLRVIREEEPPRPSIRLTTTEALGEVAADRGVEANKLSGILRGDLDCIVMKCLAKERERRYQTANELAGDLERYLKDEPILAAPPSRWYRVTAFTRRHRHVLGWVGLLAAALILGTFVSIGQALRANQASRLARQEQAHALRQAAQSQKLNAFLKYVLTMVDPDHEAWGEPGLTAGLSVKDLLDHAASEIPQRTDWEPEVEAEVRQTIGESYLGLGVYGPAERELTRSVQLWEELEGPSGPRTRNARKILAELLAYAGRYEESIGILETIREQLAAAGLGSTPEALKAEQLRAVVLVSLGQGKAAEPVARNAVAEWVKRDGPGARTTADAEEDLAQVYVGLHRFAEAEALIQRVIESYSHDPQRGPEHPATLRARYRLARIKRDNGAYPEAEQLFHDVLGAQRRKLPADHPDTLRTMSSLALLFVDEEKPALAEPLLREVVAKRTRILGPTHTDTLTTMNNLGMLYRSLGKYREAGEQFEQVLHARQATQPPDHPFTLVAMSNLGQSYWDQARYAEAVRMLEAELAAGIRAQGEQNADTLTSKNVLGRLYLELGRLEEAERLLHAADQGVRAAYPPDHAYVLATATSIALLEKHLGHLDQAAARLREILEIQRKKLDERHDSILSLRESLALIEQERGNHANAAQEFAEIARIRGQVRGPKHPRTLMTRHRQAVALREQGREAEALEILKDVAAARREVLGPAHAHLAETLLELARLEIAQADWNPARTNLTEAKTILDSSLPEGWRRFEVRHWLGVVQSHGGDHPEEGLRLMREGYDEMESRVSQIGYGLRGSLMARAARDLEDYWLRHDRKEEAAHWSAERKRWEAMSLAARTRRE